MSNVLTRRLILAEEPVQLPHSCLLAPSTGAAHFQHQQPLAEAEQGLPHLLRPILGLPPSFLRSPPSQASLGPFTVRPALWLSLKPAHNPKLLIGTHQRPQAAIGTSIHGLGLPDGI